MSSKYERKRKHDLDKDMSKEGSRHRSRDRSSKRKELSPKRSHGRHHGSERHGSSRHKVKSDKYDDKRSHGHHRSSRRSPKEEEKGTNRNREESLSVTDTNKLRAEFGLAPLILDNEASQHGTDDVLEDGLILTEDEKLFIEDGVKIVHKQAKNWADKKELEKKKEYEQVLNEEADLGKGVGAMLKLAGARGYLPTSDNKNDGDSSWKQLLESKRFSTVDQSRYDIEEKTMRKLERLGTTGSGPIRPFAEKLNYQPKIEINYTDSKGRIMGGKEAFRNLSWKFHGKGPGKKQLEKYQAQVEKKDKLKMMNSSDTPLYTLDKQRNKQEQLGTPYLILSGKNRDTGAPLQKD